MFGKTGTDVSFTQIEEEIRRFWQFRDIPEAVLAQRRKGPRYRLIQEPLATVGRRQAGRLALVCTTDLLVRYHTMCGHAVSCQTTWSCHGLPVEASVEALAGRELARDDVGQFNAACRQAAAEGVQRGEAEALWLGAWLDAGNTSSTMEPSAVGTAWAALRQLWDQGRLKQDLRVTAFCPSCATELTDSDATEHTTEVTSVAAWVCLPWDGERNAYFLVRTQTPWMLMGLVALAVHPEGRYALVEPMEQESMPPMRLLLAEAALDRELTGPYRLVRRLGGKSLRGARYRPAFTFVPADQMTNRVVLSQSVSPDQGTGLLPVTPAFDPSSLALAQARQLPIPALLDHQGRLTDALSPWRGLTPLEAEPLLVSELERRGLLYRRQSERRQQALCPHCHSALQPVAQSVWHIEMAEGPWILSRHRAWGTPLPAWICENCGDRVLIAGLEDLARRTGQEVSRIDPHRPGVDHLTFPCPACGKRMWRLAQIVDASFEEAVLPWSVTQEADAADLAIGLGRPNQRWLTRAADMSALLRRSPASVKVLLVPELGPTPAWDRTRPLPADAVRWAAYTGTDPERATDGFLRSLWLLAAVPGEPAAPDTSRVPPTAGQLLLDRWLLARLHRAIGVMTHALDACEPGQAAGELAALVMDLAEWYAPLRHGLGHDPLAILCRLVAPFVPHVAEAIHRQKVKGPEDSVHLESWSALEASWEDRELLSQMVPVWRLARLGQAARAQVGLDPGQPLRQALLARVSERVMDVEALLPLADLLAQALGVSRVEFTPEAAAQTQWQLVLAADTATERSVDPAAIQASLSNLDPASARSLVTALWDGFSVSTEVDGQAITLLPGEVRIAAVAQPGWAAAAEDGWLVLLERADTDTGSTPQATDLPVSES